MKRYQTSALLALLSVSVSIGLGQEKKSKGDGPQATAGQRATQSKEGIVHRLIGTWKLISLERRRADGQMSYPLGREPKGYISYDSTGHMGVHLMNPERKTLNTGSDLERGYIAYFGTYEVNEKDGVVIHHMEGNTNPSLTGTDYIRYYEFDGDSLVLTAAYLVNGQLAPKSPNSLRVTWRRVK